MKIKATDLRIGNYLHYMNGDDDLLVNVLSIGPRLVSAAIGINDKNGDFMCFYDKVKGIPLTEELLLKMGFELNPDAETDAFEKYRHKTIKGFTLEMFNNEGWVINGLDQWLTPEPFKYLHQLQNKFYFSTDLELTLS